MILEGINTRRFHIRTILPTDDLNRYLKWMTDPEAYPFIESASRNFSKVQLIDYLQEVTKSSNILQLGIYTLITDLHIGNIKFHDIDIEKKSSFVGFLIGEKDWQGRGVASEVFLACSTYLKQNLGVETFQLGVHRNHEQAIHSYLKMGFKKDDDLDSMDERTIGMTYCVL